MERNVRGLTGSNCHGLLRNSKCRMPRFHVIRPRRNVIDRERACLFRLREIRVIEDEYRRLRPGMEIARDFELCR